MSEKYNPNEILRRAVYEILMSSNSDMVKYVELSKRLSNDYKINIEPDVLKIIFENWDRKKDYSIFTKKDENWLDVWTYMEYIKRKYKKQNFGKHRWKNWDYGTSYYNRTGNTSTVWRGGTPYNGDYFLD